MRISDFTQFVVTITKEKTQLAMRITLVKIQGTHTRTAIQERDVARHLVDALG